MEIFYYSKYVYYTLPMFSNRIGGVMVSVLALSAVDRGFEPRLGQIKDYEIGMCCFFAKHAALRRKSNVSETYKRSLQQALCIVRLAFGNRIIERRSQICRTIVIL